MSEDEKLLKEAKKLPWEDRLTHKNWKVRNDANIDLAALCDSIADPKDSRLREFVADSNAPVQGKALDALIAYLKAADADVARYAKEVCDAIVAKCLTGRPKTVEKAQMVFLLWVELEAVEAFLLITDVNIAVAVEAIQAIGNLAKGLRAHFTVVKLRQQFGEQRNDRLPSGVTSGTLDAIRERMKSMQLAAAAGTQDTGIKPLIPVNRSVSQGLSGQFSPSGEQSSTENPVQSGVLPMDEKALSGLQAQMERL